MSVREQVGRPDSGILGVRVRPPTYASYTFSEKARYKLHAVELAFMQEREKDRDSIKLFKYHHRRHDRSKAWTILSPGPLSKIFKINLMILSRSVIFGLCLFTSRRTN